MGREVRHVPATWTHPKDESGRYKPLYPGEDYERRSTEFVEKVDAEGLQAAIDWCGQAPDVNDYMPNWPQSERTHYMMYEDTTEGTPISPAFTTPEELARWLADNGASSFGSSTATYEQWLPICQGEWAPSLIIANGVMRSGVEASTDPKP